MRENYDKNINKIISAPKHHQTTTVSYFLSSVIQFDKFFHPMALYENYLICILMNIKENFKKLGQNHWIKEWDCTYMYINTHISGALHPRTLHLGIKLIPRHSTFTWWSELQIISFSYSWKLMKTLKMNEKMQKNQGAVYLQNYSCLNSLLF